jgi:hypothetical protein
MRCAVYAWRGLGSEHIGQGHNIQGRLCPRGTTSKNFRLGTHLSGTHQPCIACSLDHLVSRGSVVGQVEQLIMPDIKWYWLSSCRPHKKAGEQRMIGSKEVQMRGQRQVEKWLGRTAVFSAGFTSYLRNGWSVKLRAIETASLASTL